MKGFVLPPDDNHFSALGDDIARYQEPIFIAAMLVTPKRRLAIDVGAHVGIFSRRMATIFEDVLAFEPDSVNYACLVENSVALGVVPVHAAIGKSKGRGTTRIDSQANSGARGFVYYADGNTAVFAIDDFHLGVVDLIKIDTEGCEHDVIVGAVETLKRCHPTLIIERPSSEVSNILTMLNYRHVHTINKDSVFAEKK